MRRSGRNFIRSTYDRDGWVFSQHLEGSMEQNSNGDEDSQQLEQSRRSVQRERQRQRQRQRQRRAMLLRAMASSRAQNIMRINDPERTNGPHQERLSNRNRLIQYLKWRFRMSILHAIQRGRMANVPQSFWTAPAPGAVPIINSPWHNRHIGRGRRRVTHWCIIRFSNERWCVSRMSDGRYIYERITNTQWNIARGPRNNVP